MKRLAKITFIGNVVITIIAFGPGLAIYTLEGEWFGMFYFGLIGAFLAGVWQVVWAIIMLINTWSTSNSTYRNSILIYLALVACYFLGTIPFAYELVHWDMILWYPAIGIPFVLYVLHFYHSYTFMRHA